MTATKKLLIYKILLFAFALFIAFMPSTAMRNKEVNSRVIVEILGVDGGGDEVSLTAQYVMPSGDQQGSAGKDTVTVKGETVDSAVEALGTALGRRAELGHCSLVIVGKEAKPETLGTLMTATDVTADVMVAAAKDKAKDLIGDITDFMKKTGATDADFIAYSAQRSQIATNTLLGFLSDLGSASRTAFMPLVEMLEDDKQQGGEQGGQGGDQGGGQSGQGGDQSGGQSGQSGEKKESTGMRVDKLAVYGSDGTVCGVLEPEAARGVAWVSAPIEKGTVCSDVEFEGKTIKGVCGRLLKKHASVKVDAKSGTATIKIKAYIEPHGDKFTALLSTDNKKAAAAIVRGYKQKIIGDVKSAYDASMLCGCDPLFIDREFYRYYPKYFESGYDRSSIEVKYVVDIALK